MAHDPATHDQCAHELEPSLHARQNCGRNPVQSASALHDAACACAGGRQHSTPTPPPHAYSLASPTVPIAQASGTSGTQLPPAASHAPPVAIENHVESPSSRSSSSPLTSCHS